MHDECLTKNMSNATYSLTRILSQLQVSSSHSVVLLYKGFSSLLDLELSTPRSPAPLLNFFIVTLLFLCFFLVLRPRRRRRSRRSRGCHSTGGPCRPCSTARGSAPAPRSRTGSCSARPRSSSRRSSASLLTSRRIWNRKLYFSNVTTEEKCEKWKYDSLALLSLVSAAGPEMLVSHSWLSEGEIWKFCCCCKSKSKSKSKYKIFCNSAHCSF